MVGHSYELDKNFWYAAGIRAMFGFCRVLRHAVPRGISFGTMHLAKGSSQIWRLLIMGQSFSHLEE